MEQEYKVKIAKRLKKKKRMVHKYETIKNKEEHFLHLKKKKEHFLQLCSGHESRLFSFMIWWREMRNIGESSKLKGENI